MTIGIEQLQDHVSLLKKADNDLEVLIQELDSEIQSFGPQQKVPAELRYNVYPLLRKLRIAQKEAKDSLKFFQMKHKALL